MMSFSYEQLSSQAASFFEKGKGPGDKITGGIGLSAKPWRRASMLERAALPSGVQVSEGGVRPEAIGGDEAFLADSSSID